MLANVPWVCRQILQWQKCVGKGIEEFGTVNVRVEDVQRHVAVSVLVWLGTVSVIVDFD
jgi:hypothetical protein